MANEPKIEDSPFYVDYQNGGKMKVLSVKLEPNKLKTLKRHLKDKDTEFTISHYTNMIITEYLQKQCLQKKTFKKSIFAIFNMDKLKKDKNPVTPLFVTDNSRTINGMISSYVPIMSKSNNHQTKYDYMDEEATYKAHEVSIADFKDNMLQEFDKPLQDLFISKLKHQELSDKINVLEICLNNYLDVSHDGIFSNVSDSSIHDGVNFIETNIGFFGIIYEWKVKEDYSIEIIAMQVCEQQKILDLLLEHNSQLYKWYIHFFMNNHISMNERDVLKNKYDKLQYQMDKSSNIIQEEKRKIKDWQKELKEVENQLNQ